MLKTPESVVSCPLVETARGRATWVLLASGALAACGQTVSTPSKLTTKDPIDAAARETGRGGGGGAGGASGGTAAADATSPVPCTPGTRDCLGTVPRLCDPAGLFRPLAACAGACESGQCVSTCTGTEPGCDGQFASNCASGAWSHRKSCGVIAGSTPATDVPLCTDGRCTYPTPRAWSDTCRPVGYQFDSAPPCSFLLPTAIPRLDSNSGGLWYVLANGTASLIPHVQAAEDCLDLDGWYFDPPATPTNAVVCPHTCSAPQSSKIELGIECSAGSSLHGS